MAADPGDPFEDGGQRLPDWIGGVGIGQLQILQLQAVEPEKRLSPFIVGKSLANFVGDIESASTEAGGLRYVLRVRDAAQVRKLLTMKALFDGTAVSVQMHPILNTRRCVISCREIQNEKEEVILEGLKKDGVIGVRRITRIENGQRVNTPTLILTVNGTSVPEHIRVGPLRVKTRLYFPDPMLCYRCYAYGHTKQRCKSGEKCRNCSGSHDLTGECKAEAFCFHCKEKHSPASRSCPKYLIEKEIIRLRVSKGISHQEAAKQVLTGGGTYAEVSKLQERLLKAQLTPTVAEEMKKKDDLIRQLTETIAMLSKRVEDLEKRKSKKENKKSKQQQSTSNQQQPTNNNQQDEEANEMDFETGSEFETDQEKNPNAATGAASGKASEATLGVAEASSKVSGTIPKTSSKVQKRPNPNEIIFPTKKASDIQSPNQFQLLDPRLRPTGIIHNN